MNYTGKNTTLKRHNMVELWLLNAEGNIIAYFNLRYGKVELVSGTISEHEAAVLILHHLWSQVSLEEHELSKEYAELKSIVDNSPLNRSSNNG